MEARLKELREKEMRIEEAYIQGCHIVYLCENHEWYVGRSEESKKIHYLITKCEALPTDIREAQNIVRLSKKFL